MQNHESHPGEEPHVTYWRQLYPDYADPETDLHWYGKWKTMEQCIGLWNERERLRAWYQGSGCTSSSDPHVVTVASYHATPLRSLTANVCLGCLWVSADLAAEHSAMSIGLLRRLSAHEFYQSRSLQEGRTDDGESDGWPDAATWTSVDSDDEV